MRLATRILRIFFHLLYHNLAWSYDLVAGLVSRGRWRNWTRSALPFIEGRRVLELGHGPGYLQRDLLDSGFDPVGLDESQQMGNLARRKYHKDGYTIISLVRGRSQDLPFPPGSFDSVFATFPSEYIYDPLTLEEVRRILHPGGRLVVLPAAWITGKGLPDQFLAWLFRITGQAPRESVETLSAQLTPMFLKAGYVVDFHLVDDQESSVLIILAVTKNEM